MVTSPETQPSLLVRIRNERDEDSWSRFVEVYAPAVYGFLRQRGLQDADAADLTQEVMTKVSTAIKTFNYQPEAGSFRSWLFTVVQNRLRNFWQRDLPRQGGTGETQFHQQLLEHPDERNCAADQWDREYETRLFNYVADLVRHDFQESTWQAFWKTAVKGDASKEVAQELKMTTAAVRLAKARVLNRIKEQIRLLEEE